MINYHFEEREYSDEELKEIFKQIMPEPHLDVFYAFLEENFEKMSEEDMILWSRIMQLVDINFEDNDDS